MTGIVTGIHRYPIKGMTPHPLTQVLLEAGETLPLDRAYAIENGPGRFDPGAPRHLPKISFVMLMRNERLVWRRALVDRWCGKVGVNQGAINATLSH